MNKRLKKEEENIKQLESLIYTCLHGYNFNYLFSSPSVSQEYALAVKLYDNGYRYLPKADKHTIKNRLK